MRTLFLGGGDTTALTTFHKYTQPTPQGGRCTMRPRPVATPWPSEMPPPATTVTMSLRRRAGDDSPYHAGEAPAVAEPRLRPAQVLVRDSRRPAGGDAGVFRPAR